ncbi:TlpA family protein disulfide reductase [Campylobacter fetus subsp. venerealis]|uniref:TlpA family protein disulfide reductase n=1 Tax=Campylobacter fetus TaxID=196 RepID=UPI0018E8DD09|nr:TlpA family protein disulfide reductase [Campylobacter fetus]QQF51522.1 TlpA family protein disulfide reductase [Campylobacter fetus subsp. venerealis]
MKKLTLILTFLTLFLVGCSAQKEEEITSFTPYKTGDEIELTSVIGSKTTLVRTQNGFKLKDSDKIVMIDIFGTYCVPCQKEAPHLMDYQLKNSDDFMIIGLIYFENIDDKGIVENFSKKYNAYYFISNSKENPRIVDQILHDIDYKRALQIPFKVVLKNGVYQTLSDTLGDSKTNKFYLGEVSTAVISKDVNRIKSAN